LRALFQRIVSRRGVSGRGRGETPGERWGVRSLAALVILGLVTGAPGAAAGPARPPAAAAYTITTSAQDTESLRAEGRLAQFIRALQRGRRQRAAELLSSRVGARARQALMTKQWLPARPGGTSEFSQIFFWRDIQIHTHSITPQRRKLVVAPRKIPFAPGKKKRPGTGLVEVMMVLERGEWWVDLRPPKKLA
jgi:hypothetical protein